MPVFDRDPTGIALAVWLVASSVLVALDDTGALNTRWGPVIQAVIGLVVLLAVRRSAYKPSTVRDLVERADVLDGGH